MNNIEKKHNSINNEEENVEVLKQKIERLRAENKELKDEVENLMHDELTGLKGRKFFTEKSQQDVFSIISPETETENRKEGFKSVSFLFCDIDYFKKVNDIYGHDFGDKILKEVAWIIKENIRKSDTACRWGGEEIVISLLGADEKKAVEKAEKLRKAVEEKIEEKYRDNPKYSSLKVSLSIGISSFESGVGFEELIKRGDEAMYLAKGEGKNRVKTYSQVLEKEKAERNKL